MPPQLEDNYTFASVKSEKMLFGLRTQMRFVQFNINAFQRVKVKKKERIEAMRATLRQRTASIYKVR